jgi:hypothetical protein
LYVLKPGIKGDLDRHWSLPDKVFFASGACHILAYAFLNKHPTSGFGALWIKPARGFTGNHIVVVRDRLAFDYHGYSNWDRLICHMTMKANRWWLGWNATLVSLPMDVLISENKSRGYDGLWLREPKQFLHDALPRAERFLARHPEPPPP